jgi:APA family basic amino acid/polyamine antiporter
LVLVAVWFTAFTEPVGDMLAASRVAYAMGETGELPGWLGEIHPRFRVPRHAVIGLGLVVIVLVQFFDLRQVLAVANVFTIGWYSITHFSALKLPKERRLAPPVISVLGLVLCLGLLLFLPFWGTITGGLILTLLATARFALKRR